MPTDAPILHVGDTVLVERQGWRKIEAIFICLTPSADLKAEDSFVSVGLVELGEHGPPFVVDLEGGNWAYGGQVIAEGIQKGERDEG